MGVEVLAVAAMVAVVSEDYTTVPAAAVAGLLEAGCAPGSSGSSGGAAAGLHTASRSASSLSSC